MSAWAAPVNRGRPLASAIAIGATATLAWPFPPPACVMFACLQARRAAAASRSIALANRFGRSLDAVLGRRLFSLRFLNVAL
jgi:hypothetical protein